jgi:hypothetical protein
MNRSVAIIVAITNAVIDGAVVITVDQ